MTHNLIIIAAIAAGFAAAVLIQRLASRAACNAKATASRRTRIVALGCSGVFMLAATAVAYLVSTGNMAASLAALLLMALVWTLRCAARAAQT